MNGEPDTINRGPAELITDGPHEPQPPPPPRPVVIALHDAILQLQALRVRHTEMETEIQDIEQQLTQLKQQIRGGE